MVAVTALIHRDEGSEYGISFPDFPGCVSGGATLEDAFRRGYDVLAAHIEFLAEDGEGLPDVRCLDDLKADPVLAEDFADAVLVRTFEIPL